MATVIRQQSGSTATNVKGAAASRAKLVEQALAADTEGLRAAAEGAEASRRGIQGKRLSELRRNP